MTLSAAQVPDTSPYSIAGNGKHEGPTAEALKRAMKRAGYGFANKPLGDLNQVFNADLEAALDRWDPGKDGYGKGRWEKIRALKCPAGTPNAGQYALDAYAQDLIKTEAAAPPPSQVPPLGPCYSGGKVILDEDFTHATSGIPLYPAFDTAFSQGTSIIAPEDIEVTRTSSSNPGCAFYATGVSGLRYWFGHLDRTHQPGVKFKKGALVGKVAANNVGGGPHLHLAINVENLWGAGKQFYHSTNYTHNGYTMREQLQDGPGKKPR